MADKRPAKLLQLPPLRRPVPPTAARHLAAVRAAMNTETLCVFEPYFRRAKWSRPRIATPDDQSEGFRLYNLARFRLLSELQAVAGGASLTAARCARVALWFGRAQDLRDALVIANLGLVHTIAKRMAPEDEDLVQSGAVGLMRSVERFDRTRGFRFSSYAWRGVQRAMITETIARRRCVAETLVEQVAPGVDPDVGLFAVEALSSLRSGRQVAAVLYRHGLLGRPELKSWREIGEAMGVSGERARQSYGKAIETMRAEVMA